MKKLWAGLGWFKMVLEGLGGSWRVWKGLVLKKILGGSGRVHEGPGGYWSVTEGLVILKFIMKVHFFINFDIHIVYTNM